MNIESKSTNIGAKAAEIIKCGKNPIYFINNYVKIQHPVKGLILFNTYKFQDKCINDFKNYRFNIILKARQLGISTIVSAYCLHSAIFYRDKDILIIATKQKTAANILKKIRTSIQHLPSWLLIPKIDEDNKHTLSFSNGSRITAIPRSEDAGRSSSCSLLIVDECSHISNMNELWVGLFPTLSTGGSCILLSSPSGVGNFFHKTYVDADAKLNDFNAIRLPWNVHPEHNEEWFQKETRGQSYKYINQEFLCEFIGSGDTFAQQSDID